jgi:hypothetical protein
MSDTPTPTLRAGDYDCNVHKQGDSFFRIKEDLYSASVVIALRAELSDAKLLLQHERDEHHETAKELQKVRKARENEHTMHVSNVAYLTTKCNEAEHNFSQCNAQYAAALEDVDHYMGKLAAAEAREAALREELDHVLEDWNALVRAIGSPTNGGAVGYAAALRDDAERYREIRENGIPCTCADDCGAPCGDELDSDVDAARSAKEPDRG